MLILGLTGQSGAGKGIFSQAVKSREGVYVLDTDITARQVVCKGQPCLKELVDFFGNGILSDDGTLNRPRLAEVAFSDAEKHTKLNEITHFHIMKKVNGWLDECREKKARCAVIDAPLLFESGADKLCDITVGIIAPYDTRLKRIMKRDGIDEKNGRIRLDSQPDDSFFYEKCTYILENSDDTSAFEKKALSFIDGVLKD